MCIRLRVWSPFPQAGRGKAEPSRAAQLVVLQPQAEGSWLPWPIPAHLQQLVVQRVYSVALDGCLALPLPGFVRQEVSLHIPEGRSRRSSSPHGQLQTSHSPKTATYSSHLFPCPQPVPPRFLPPFPSQHSRVGALLGLIPIGQLPALLHMDEQRLCLLLVAQGEGDSSSDCNVPEVTSLAVDADHAPQRALQSMAGLSWTVSPSRWSSAWLFPIPLSQPCLAGGGHQVSPLTHRLTRQQLGLWFSIPFQGMKFPWPFSMVFGARPSLRTHRGGATAHAAPCHPLPMDLHQVVNVLLLLILQSERNSSHGECGAARARPAPAPPRVSPAPW